MAGRTDLEQLVYQMSADIKRLEAANRKALTDVDRTAGSAQKRYDKLGDEMGRSFGKASLAAGVAFGAIVGYATKAASDASETANAFDVAFGGLKDKAAAFAKSYSKDVGRAFDETQATMARTQLVLTGVGVAADQALGMTEAIQKRAIDIGSLFNVDDARAYQAILSGIAGEAEPMKQFGVAVNEAAVKAELLRLGFKGNAEQAPEAAKAIARLNIILAQSAKADGDAVRTKDGLANSTKAAKAEFRDAAVELGNNFLPAATKATKAAADLLGEFNQMPDAVKLAGLGFLGLVAASGPIAAVIAGLAKVIKYAGLARVALTGVMAGPALGGVAGAGIAAGAVATPVAIAAFGVAESVQGAKYQGTVKKVAQASDAAIAGALETARAQIAAAASGGPAGKPVVARLTRDVNVLLAEQKRRGAGPAAAAAEAAAAAANPAAGFGLSDALKNPVGGSKTAKAAKDSAASAAERAAKLALAQEDRANADIQRANAELLSAKQQTAVEADERLKLELQGIDQERQARKRDLDLAVQEKQLTEAQRKKVDAAEEAARKQSESNARGARDAQVAQEQLDLRIAEFDAQLSQAQDQAALAVTVADARAAQLRILDLQYQEEKARLEAVIANQDLAKATREAAQRQLDALNAGQPAREETVRRGTAGAAERFRQGNSAEGFQDRVEGVVVGSLDSLADGLAQAAVNAKNLGDVAKNVFRQMVADLLASAIKKDLLAPITGLLFPGHAAGTASSSGGWHLVGERGVELMNMNPGAQVYSNAALRSALHATPADASMRALVISPFHFHAEGAVLTEELLAQANSHADKRAAQAVQVARTAAKQDSQRASYAGNLNK